MNLSINGQSQVPPGFRFHPTEEELLHYYLRKKVAYHKIDLNVIPEVDLNKLEPWDIQEKCKIGSTPQNDWYFFSHKDKKYPTGTRTNRATTVGFWKATGRDKIIYSGPTRIGLRKTLVFYKGRAPHGQKSDWIMHEYRLDDTTVVVADSNLQEEGWVVCRVFKKRNYQKAVEGPRSSTTSIESKISHLLSSTGDSNGVLDQILLYMGRSCKMESETFVSGNNINMQERFMHLPRLQETPTLSSSAAPLIINQDGFRSCDDDEQQQGNRSVNHWAMLDQLVASQLNGQEADTTSKLQQRTDPESSEPPQVTANNYSSASESDFWGFTKSLWSSSSLDPLCHLSV